MTCATCGCTTVENWVFIGSIILMTCGVAALIYSHRIHEKLSVEKYRKINAISLATPGLFLVLVGVFIMMFPVILHYFENKKEAANINISVVDNVANAPAKRNSVNSNEVSILLPVDQDKNLTPIAISVLDDTARNLSSKIKSKIIISSFGFTSDAPGKKEADKASKRVLELLVHRGADNCTIDQKQSVQEKQGATPGSVGVCVTIQGGK